jgi:hypothetical protein
MKLHYLCFGVVGERLHGGDTLSLQGTSGRRHKRAQKVIIWFFFIGTNGTHGAVAALVVLMALFTSSECFFGRSHERRNACSEIMKKDLPGRIFIEMVNARGEAHCSSPF